MFKAKAFCLIHIIKITDRGNPCEEMCPDVQTQGDFWPWVLVFVSPGPAEGGDPGHGAALPSDSVHLRRGWEAPPGAHRCHQTLHGSLWQRRRGQLPQSHLPLPQVRLSRHFQLHIRSYCIWVETDWTWQAANQNVPVLNPTHHFNKAQTPSVLILWQLVCSDGCFFPCLHQPCFMDFSCSQSLMSGFYWGAI